MNNDLEQNKTGLRKISDSKQVCLSPEHNQPSHIVLEYGTYECICPSCGKRVEFVVEDAERLLFMTKLPAHTCQNKTNN